MKRLSPLALMQGRKVQKFNGGGMPDTEFGDLDWAVAAQSDNEYQPVLSDEEIAAELDAASEENFEDLGDFFNPQGSYADDAVTSYYREAAANQLGDVPANLIQFLGGQPGLEQVLGALAPSVPMQQSAPSSSAETSTPTTESKSWFNTLLGGGEDKKPSFDFDPKNQAQMLAVMSGKAHLTPEGKMVMGQPEAPTWQKLLQLGLVGMGGLSSFADAKQKNKAMKQYYNQVEADRERQLAEYEAGKAWAARHSLPGGYAGLNVAGRKFNRPV